MYILWDNKRDAIAPAYKLCAFIGVVGAMSATHWPLAETFPVVNQSYQKCEQILEFYHIIDISRK